MSTKKDTVLEHTGTKTVAVSTKKEAAHAADVIAKEAEAVKPPPINPNSPPKPAPKKTVVIKKAFQGFKAKRK